MFTLHLIKKSFAICLYGLSALCLINAPSYGDENVYQLDNITIDNRYDNELVIYNLVEDSPMQDESENDMPLANMSYPLSNAAKKMLSAPLPYREAVLQAAKQTKLDVALIDAVIAVESSYNAHAISKKGAIGLMQVMPKTAQSLVTTNNSQSTHAQNSFAQSKHAKQQVLLGAMYLRKMLDLFEGNLSLALAAYNAGPQAVKKHHGNIPPYQETQRYVPKVLAYYQFLKQQTHLSINHRLQK